MEFSGLRKASKKPSRTKKTDVDDVRPDHANDYDTFAKDIIGENDSDSDDGGEDRGKKGRRNRDEEEAEKPISFMFFDFRRFVLYLNI